MKRNTHKVCMSSLAFVCSHLELINQRGRKKCIQRQEIKLVGNTIKITKPYQRPMCQSHGRLLPAWASCGKKEAPTSVPSLVAHMARLSTHNWGGLLHPLARLILKFLSALKDCMLLLLLYPSISSTHTTIRKMFISSCFCHTELKHQSNADHSYCWHPCPMCRGWCRSVRLGVFVLDSTALCILSNIAILL